MNYDPDCPVDFPATPVPSEVALMLWVGKHDLGRHGVCAVGTTYKDAPYSNKPFVNDAQWGAYVFVRGVEGASPTSLMFGPAKTDAEMLVPFETVMGGTPPEVWPPILRRVTLKQDDDFPLATAVIRDGKEGIANAARNYVTVDYVPPVRGGRVLVRRYFGPRPHSIPFHLTPVPTAVNWDIPGAGDFYTCLHDDIYVRPIKTGTQILVGEEARALSGVAGGEFFPATNFKTWQPFVFDDAQREVAGGWLREEKIAIPPPVPKTIRDII